MHIFLHYDTYDLIYFSVTFNLPNCICHGETSQSMVLRREFSYWLQFMIFYICISVHFKGCQGPLDLCWKSREDFAITINPSLQTHVYQNTTQQQILRWWISERYACVIFWRLPNHKRRYSMNNPVMPKYYTLCLSNNCSKVFRIDIQIGQYYIQQTCIWVVCYKRSTQDFF